MRVKMPIAAIALAMASAAGAQSLVEIDREVFVETSEERDGAVQRVLAPAETLERGDLIVTRDHGLRPLAWIGRRRLSAADLHAAPNFRPVLIRAHSFGPGLPARDIRVSPHHRILTTGAATMLGAITAIARLGIRQRVSCLLGLVENMPSGTATRPGDIVQAMNGKTIEVINTDAEGRLVLADALTYAVRLGATHLVDAATLTGAVSVALGSVNIGLLGNNDSLSPHLTATGKTMGEHFWSLPMNDDYLEPMKGDLSDLRNAGTDRKAGTITAAKFLEQFVDGTPWAHLDIAGTANLDKGLPNAPKGASGIAVRTLVRAVETWPSGGTE